jgi:hypothetical protein
VFRFLEPQRNLAVEAALLEALPTLDAPVQAAAIDLLIRRGHAPSLSRLVRGYAGYTTALQSEVQRRFADLSSGVRDALASGSVDERVRIIELIERTDEWSLAYLLSTALSIRCTRTRDRAAGALQELTRRALNAAPPGASDPDGMRRESTRLRVLGDALTDALRSWDVHHEPRALTAVLRLIRHTEPELRRRLDQRRSSLPRVVGGLLHSSDDPLMARAMLHALAIPSLRKAAAEGIARPHCAAFLRALADHRWIVSDPVVRQGCKFIRELRWLDVATVLGSLEASVTTALFDLVAATAIRSERKMELFRSAIEVDAKRLGRAALWHIVQDSSEAATSTLWMISRGDSDSLRVLAEREWGRRSGGAARHPRQRAVPVEPPGRDRVRVTDESRWAVSIVGEIGAKDMTENVRDQLVRGAGSDSMPLRHVDGDGSARGRGASVALRAKLTNGSSLDRVRALGVLRRLRMTSEFAAEVHRLCVDANPVVRSSAVSALSDVPGATTRRILQRALGDPDARVQANAVEALDDDVGESRLIAAELIPKLKSEHNRVRANAVRALLRLNTAEAGQALLDMLEAGDPAHRLSALWVVEQMKLGSVVDQVARIGRDDPDFRVRRRAAGVVERLTGTARAAEAKADERTTPTRRASRPAGAGVASG